MLPREVVITLYPHYFLKALVLSPAVVILGWWVFSWPWDSVSAPAWVQAVGSVGAVLAAIWVSDRQHRLERIDRLRREYHYMFKAFNVSVFTQQAVKAVVGCVSADPANLSVLRVYVGRLQEAYAEMALFAYPSIADQAFADNWISYKRTVSLLIEEMELHLAGTPTSAKGVSAVAESGHQQVSRMMAELERYSLQVGGKVWEEHHP